MIVRRYRSQDRCHQWFILGQKVLPSVIQIRRLSQEVERQEWSRTFREEHPAGTYLFHELRWVMLNFARYSLLSASYWIYHRTYYFFNKIHVVTFVNIWNAEISDFSEIVKTFKNATTCCEKNRLKLILNLYFRFIFFFSFFFFIR